MEFPENLSLLVVSHESTEKISFILHEYFNMHCGAGMFGQTLLEFLFSYKSIQDAVDYAYPSFGNPLFVFDTNYNLIASNIDQIDPDEVPESLLNHHRFSDKEFEMANRNNHIHNRVKNSDIPIQQFNEELGRDQLLCAISTQRDLGHIVLLAVNKPIEPVDHQLMITFKMFVDQRMNSDSFIRNSKGFNYEFFFRDLIEGKFVKEHALKNNINYIKNDFSGNLFCMVVVPTCSSMVINAPHIRNIFERHFPSSKTLIYNGQIIVVFQIQNHAFLSSEYIAEINEICKNNDIFAGVSNAFDDITHLADYYQQAIRAIELGSEDTDCPAVFLYENYCIEHITNIFLQKESGDVFCHPKMKALINYDKQNNSNLAYTLYMYLIHGSNTKETSEAMCMHRTSLIYRLKKIYEITQCEDFKNYKERIHLILSYETQKNKVLCQI